MSLQVWLPLNGDLHNQGLSNITIINNGATIDNSGKIGKCYGFDGMNDYIQGTYKITSNISFCCWVYFPTVPSGRHVVDARNTAGTLGYQPIYINTGSIQLGGSGSSYQTVYYTWEANTWYHICITYDNNYGKLYINGNLINTTSAKGFGSGEDCQFTLGSRCNQSNYSNIKMNDFRIYDHTLSAKEVEEIAKGLVLHYKLDDAYSEATTNLITTVDGLSNTCYNGAINKYNYGTNTDMYKTTGTFQGKFCTKVYMGTAGNNAYPYVHFDPFNAKGTEIQTLSFDYYPTIQNTLIPYSYSGSYNFSYTSNGVSGSATNASQIIIPVNVGQWNHITITAQRYDTTNTSRGIGYVRIGSASHTSTTTDYWLFANVQVEAKDHATGYAGVGNSRGGQYDTNIYIEPDGSKWIRIAHHNNPTVSGYFSNSDTWTTGVYLSEDKWYAVDSAIAQVSVYEFMVKQKTTSSATETKYRWTQDKNPLIAVYNDVKPGTVTFNTSSGYTNSNYGGLWQMNSSARLCIANSSSGNWYGAFGCWTAYLTNQMPGFPNTTISTGYMDLYIRIDNTNLGIVYDCSGYSNNGTIIGSLEIIGDSSRYSCATKFNGSSAIKVNDNNWMAQGASDLTVNIWAYMDNWSNWNGHRLYSCTEGGGFNIENTVANSLTFPVCVYTNTAHSATGYIPTESRVAILKTDLTSGWHMFTYIYTETECQCYLDGVLYQTKPYTSYGVYFNINGSRLFLGCEANGVNPYSPYFIGQESDFRIYYTALTPEQIKELYNTSMSIDNNGNIHARELVEL